MSNRIGTLKIEGSYAILQYERRLPHDSEVVWKAITDPKQVSAWFSTTTKVDPRLGGTLIHQHACRLSQNRPHFNMEPAAHL